MKRTISRNIAIVSAIFIVAFSIMLITNYFQVSSTDTIQSEVIEKLKQANEENSDNPQLQEQIRELDLLARKAYFTNLDRLKVGAAILLIMVIVFVISLRIYFAKNKDIPDKDIDPIDDWIIKSKTRKYIIWIAGCLALSGILFAALTSPYLKNKTQKAISETEIVTDSLNSLEPLDSLDQETATPTDTAAAPIATDTIEISKVTHNAFRGNNSTGINNAKKIPTSWNLSSGKNILWKVKVPRKGYNSPVINGNKVFFSGADENVRELFCYELNSGKELWKLAAKNIPGSRVPATTEDTGLAAPTVAINGKQVCAIFATGDVICADMDGKQLWAKNIGVPDNHYGYASSLLIFGNSLIIQYDNLNAKKVISLDLTTGNQRWVKERTEKHPAWSSPIIAYVNKKPQLILVGNPGITSYNPNNGEQYWRVEAMSGEPTPSPAYANGIVFAATEYATMVAINAEDGSELWRNDEFMPEVSSPVATKDFVFVATSYGVVASFNAQTGELIKSMETNVEFYSSPIIVEGKIYLICTKGKVFVFSAKGDFSLMNSFETGEKTFATPAFTDKKIVIRTQEGIYCVSSEL
ncbi:MAG: PQQ-binding-like beta-propeller repeat protein [Dysgonamonadaceae bacterium]|jgi:outer membrane protein assembly factor BamB|nr:PQQ-binding-like beta-propeller repeat protein [Dysgonamonadaceae bacterium]